ncbi:MAG: ComEC/Rec2 family competence protein [Bacilli bacterium]|nr:ComEC/Rec2 family competence protein [Bacilli bacterium]
MPRIKTFTDTSYSGTVRVTKIYDNYVYLKDGSGNRFISYDNYCGDSKCVLTVKGKLVEMDNSGTPLVSDYKDFLWKQGIKYILFIDDYEIKSASTNYREVIIQCCTGNLSAPVAQFIRLLVFGDKTDSLELYGELKTLAVLQLFVVSGFHFNILYLVLERLTSRFIKHKWVILILLIPYLYLLDFSVPALRAFIMLLLRCINQEYLDNSYNNYDFLFIAAFCCLIINPLNIYSFSFLMTFLINFNLYLITRVKFKKKIHQVYLVPLLTYLGFIPILLYLNYELNLVAPIYNAVYALFIPVFYLVSILVCFFNFLEVVFLPFVLGFNQVLEWSINHSIILIMGKPTIVFTVIYYLSYYYFLYNYDLKIKKRCIGVGVYLLILLTYKYYEPYLSNNCSVTYINVNQGDCALVRLPYNSYNILIDTGGSQTTDYATSRIIPYLKALGVKKLDYVILSHEDFDHCGALPSLKEHFTVTNELHGNSWSSLTFGKTILTNLNRNTYDNENDNSSVIHFELMDRSFLFMGDASSVVEQQLIIDNPSLDVDVLKAGHHGAKTSSSYAFLEYYQPGLVILSVGKNNHYGHPSLEVLANLYHLQIPYYRTDYQGSVVIESIPNWVILLKKVS